ncbi:MAG: extracellular solute-binding protein [Defluviitaleaceae bacterium]|nr:extracellular solute-binding protein [Defluviitaleaceae bacterium]MCL2836447.1 extracellular solute-binding protein [Defluviitaleaceae bacterium]
MGKRMFLFYAAAIFACLFVSSCRRPDEPAPIITLIHTEEPIPSPTPTPTQPPLPPEPPEPPEITPVVDLGGAVIGFGGVPNPQAAAVLYGEYAEIWQRRHYEIEMLFNITMAFDAIGGRSIVTLAEELAERMFEGEPAADIILVDRAGMEQLARAGLVEDITDAVLNSGLPEAYYAAGWTDGRLYGFSVTPLVADSFLIYDKALIRGAGIGEMPGNLFDRGEWDWNDFYDYCLILNNLLLPGYYAISVESADLWENMVYSNGGFLYHPETGQSVQNTPSILQTKEFINRLEVYNILHSPDGPGTAVITAGNADDLAVMLEAGMEIGIVPYPWGPNIKINTGFAALENMLTSNYRATASDARVFALAAGEQGALAKADASDYIKLIITYYGLADRLEEERERERLGLPPLSSRAAAFEDLLAPDDFKRLEWLYSRPAMINAN